MSLRSFLLSGRRKCSTLPIDEKRSLRSLFRQGRAGVGTRQLRLFVLLYCWTYHSFCTPFVGAPLRTRLCLVLCLGLCPKNPQAAIVRLGELFF